MNFITGNDGRQSARRTIVLLFLLYVASNHIVWALSGGASSSNSLDAGAVGENILSSLDDFRVATGELIIDFGRICPRSISSTCESTAEMTATVLGLGK
jgi:hypothetical protein